MFCADRALTYLFSYFPDLILNRQNKDLTTSLPQVMFHNCLPLVIYPTTNRLLALALIQEIEEHSKKQIVNVMFDVITGH